MVETPGRGPGGSRFESGRSHCEGTGCSGVSYALRAGSIPALATNEQPGTGRWRNGSATPLQGEGCGFESRAVHRARPADVAQLEEARRSDRRQCGFDSRRQYDTQLTWTWRNGSAPASGAGGWEFESLRPDQCEVVELVPRLPLKQEVRVRSLASQPFDASAVAGSLKVPTSACCEGGGSFI